ncbi:MAG: hydantoinase/oxoprolinase family protein [Pseudomonadota bacterium]
MAERTRPLFLGVDTGGTYTDAVVLDGSRLDAPDRAVLAKAKSPTTHAALERGIAGAVTSALVASAADPADIALVSLSTTLATNALVEGQGRPAALIMIGFSAADAERQGLAEALSQDPLILIEGGHDAMGSARDPLDEAALTAALDALPEGIEAVAVCGQFAVRNPAHEVRAREIIRNRRGIPVTCSHELTAAIGGPRRALTALLNARLTALIDGLIAACAGLMAKRDIDAPLMVVRGDGALVAADYARERPIETILSGPAASLVGAGWMTRSANAIVSDIGGTTTDIAVLTDGRPRLDPAGARVGGHRTSVEAVAMRTHGLGGDSLVEAIEGSLPVRLSLGPRRAVPVAMLAAEHPEIVHAALDRCLAETRTEPASGRFYHATGRAVQAPSAREAEILERLSAGPTEAGAIERLPRLAAAARRLLDAGRVRLSAFTPTDAAHVLGLVETHDRAAARKAATLFARRRGADGRVMADTPEALSERVLALLERRSAEHILDAALTEDGYDAEDLATSPLGAAALDGRVGIVAPRLALSIPLIGLGASAPLYYPGIGRRLGVDTEVPLHADVANAIGAVVGGVQIRRSASVSVPAEGRFRAHLPSGPADFADADTATAALAEALEADVMARARAAGTDAPEIRRQTERREATIEGRTVLVEAVVTVSATGRPRLVRPAA